MKTQVKERLKVHLRWVVKSDTTAVLAIEALSWPDPWTEEDFLVCLRQRNCIGQVAEVGEMIVGYVVYELHKSEFHVLNLAVHPEHRLCGVGQQIVDKLTSKLRPDGRTRITADVPETQMDALVFLRSMGFEATRVMRDFFEHEDGYRMVYRIRAEESSEQEDET